MSRRAYLWGMVVVLVVAAALRLAAFGEVPPGLYHDEAFNGLDALDIFQGRLALYFPANNGREPLFIYLVAATVGLLGRSPFALRLAAFPVGLLTVAATAAMGRALFSRRVGLLAAAVLAVTLWHVHLSRVGFRAVLMPLFTVLMVWQGGLGVRTGWRRHWLAAGAVYGLSFYTYTATRFTPVALVAFGLYLILVMNHGAAEDAEKSSSNFMRLRVLCVSVVFFLSALATLVPLLAYTVAHPDIVLGRPGQVSILNPAVNGGDLWGTLRVNALRTAGMFFVRGDRIWRHNVPWRPVFDPALGAAFVAGLVVAVRRARRDVAAGFVLIWVAVMALPTLLAEDAPHFLRAVGVLPVVALLPALGLDWVMGIGAGTGSVPAGYRLGAVILVLLVGLTSTGRAYFGDYARDPMTGYWFEEGAAALAGRVNRFLGVGWDGERMEWGEPADRRVYLDPALWEKWPQVRFLVAAPDAVTVGLEGEAPASPVAVFVWPYGDWRRAWSLLPSLAGVMVEEGPLSQGDRDPHPYLTYLAFFACREGPAAPALARFAGGVELVGVSVTSPPPLPGGGGPEGAWGEGEVRVRLRWRVAAPPGGEYTVFLHYLRDGEIIAQGDAPPAGGYYPTSVWRPGDVVVDEHGVAGVGRPLPGRDALRIGLWRPETGEVLPLVNEAGEEIGDWVVVPVEPAVLSVEPGGP